MRDRLSEGVDHAPRCQGHRSTIAAVALLALADLLLFADVLGPGTTKVPTAWDVEIHGRLFQFAAAELRQGRLPLWNPHLFSGMPALGNPNGMTLYPLSLLSIVLPLPMVITYGTVFHTFLAGASTYLWTLRRGLHPAGCLLAGAMVSLGGPFVARIHAGHLSVLVVMAWTPLLLLAVDELFRRPSPGWLVIGAVTVAMQALGGHPQFLFYSLLAAGVTVVLRLRGAPWPGRVVGGFVLMVAGGVSLAAVQLVAVIDALGEAARGGVLGQGSASAFSMTWSALVMLLVPNFYGHGSLGAYWGDWLYWELTPFVGVVGLAVAAYGAIAGDRSKKCFAGVLATSFLLLALGDKTPVFHLLHDFVPPFDRFRASARALFYFGLFAAMLAAVGMDALLRNPRRSRLLPTTLVCVAVSLGGFACWIGLAVSGDAATARDDIEALLRMPPEAREPRLLELAAGSTTREETLRAAARARDLAVDAEGPERGEPAPEDYGRAYVDAMSINRWQELRTLLVHTRGYTYPLREWADPAVGRQQAYAAVVRLLIAAGTCVVVAFLLYVVPRRPNAALLLPLVGLAELLAFASSIRETFDLGALCPPSLGVFYRTAFHPAAPEDYRVHDATNPNCAMAMGVFDIWGYDPFVSSRYLDYITFTHERVDPRSKETAAVPLRRMHRSYGMLRLRYVVAHKIGDPQLLAGPSQMPIPLPHLMLVHRYAVYGSGREVLEALDSPTWDPRETVILESEPHPAPVPGPGGGSVLLRKHSNDRLEIEANTPSPALLLVTDAYSRGWRARPLSGSDQQSYDVLPANRVLRAVPLVAGRHHIRLEFAPARFGLGVCLSLSSLVMLGFVGARAVSQRRSRALDQCNRYRVGVLQRALCRTRNSHNPSPSVTPP